MNESTYRFDDFCVAPARRELWRADLRLTVQPKVLDTLIYLIQHRDRVVGRDELVAAVWGRADLTDNVLSQIVRRARHIVGDTSEGQHFIRTMPRFGYRWVRAVETSPTLPDDADATASVADLALLSTQTVRDRVHARWRMPASAMVRFGVTGLLGVALAVIVVTGGERNPVVKATHVATDASTVSTSDRVANLRQALALDQLDVAHTIVRTSSDQDRIQPEFRQLAALLALKEGRADEALDAFKTLLADLGEGGDRRLVGQVLYGAGQAESRRGQTASAQNYYERAITTLRAETGADAHATLGRVWMNLGWLLADRRALDEAEHAYANARTALETAGDLAALAQLERHIGVLLIFRYRHTDALPRFERAADLAAQANDVNSEARARMNLVNVHLTLLQPAAALAQEPRLRELRERVGDPWLAGHVDLVRVKALTANGRLGDAQVVLRAHSGWPKPDDPTLSGPWLVVAADLAFAQGAFDVGARHELAALESPWYSPKDGLAAYARWRLLAARRTLGDSEGLVEAAAAADAQARLNPDDPTIRLYALLARGEAAATRGDWAAARMAFAQALDQAETNRVPSDLMQVAARYAPFLLQHSEAAEAQKLAGRIAEWAERDYNASLVQLGVYHAAGDEAWQRALARTRQLAGERTIPDALTTAPAALQRTDAPVWVASH